MIKKKILNSHLILTVLFDLPASHPQNPPMQSVKKIGMEDKWFRFFFSSPYMVAWLVEANFPRCKISQKEEHSPDLGSDASSVWNFSARFSDVTSQGKQWWRHEMSAVFSGCVRLNSNIQKNNCIKLPAIRKWQRMSGHTYAGRRKLPESQNCQRTQ